MRIVTWNVASLVRVSTTTERPSALRAARQAAHAARCTLHQPPLTTHPNRKNPPTPQPPTARNVQLAHGSLASFFRDELKADVVCLQEVRVGMAAGLSPTTAQPSLSVQHSHRGLINPPRHHQPRRSSCPTTSSPKSWSALTVSRCELLDSGGVKKLQPCKHAHSGCIELRSLPAFILHSNQHT